MILNRTKYAGLPLYERGEDLFATVSGNNLKLSTGIRQLLQGTQRVFIDILPSGDFRLVPTSDPSAHKVTCGSGDQLSISAVGLCRTLPIPTRTRIPCVPQDDGSMLFRSGGM